MLLSSGEDQYLDLLRELKAEIDEVGFQTEDRTGVGTCKIFGRQMRFDLSKSFPLFTHKQVFMRGIFEELMWFLRGDTNIKTLLEKGVHIWDDWRYKDYKQDALQDMQEVLLTPEEFANKILQDGDFAQRYGGIGKGYGHQWRNFGAQTIEFTSNDGHVEYLDSVGVEGFDQIKWVIDEIKKNPNSRRLIVTGWNPHDVDKVDLPPCHTLFQFFVKNGKLSCQLYQRSADILLGVPFNIASYALLTHLVALECGLEVGEFIWTGGDIHVYSNQYEGLAEIVENRRALTPPEIEISKRDSIFDYEWSDITVKYYEHLGKVPMPVAV